jgi:glycosyltransferase involved in cell wall biosynthesis
MNVWIFNHYAISPGSSGGTRHYDLARELVKQGHCVTIFASSFDHQTRKEKYILDSNNKWKEERFNGVDFVWIKTIPYKKNDWRRVMNMFSYSFRAYNIAKKRNDCPDIILGSLMHPFAPLVAYILSRQFGCSFYFEERDLWPQSLIDLGKVSERNPVVRLLSRMEMFFYKKSDRIIVLFDKAVEYVKQRGINKDKIVFIPNGVDLSRYDNDSKSLPDNFENIFHKLKGKFIAIYTGAHGLANNLDIILDVAHSLKGSNIHFLLVGDGPEKERLMSRKEQERLDNVSFMPPIPKEYIPSLLKKVNVGLLPLQNSPVFKWGISPNKLYDYMASSLPVILLCNLENTPVEKARAGFVIKEKFKESLAEKLLRLANEEKDQLTKMGQNARTYVEQYHSWAFLSKKLIDVMEENMKRRNQKR